MSNIKKKDNHSAKANPAKGQSKHVGAVFWPQNWVPALILVLLPLLLYAGAMQFGYVLDDKLVLSENKFVQKGTKGVSDIFANESFTGFLGQQEVLVAGARYRPLSIATFAIEHQLFGVNPGLSHFFNILLYGLTALLIYRLLHLVAPPSKDTKWYLGLPFVAALLFALHPLHTEVVANIKGRDEILALLLALASAYYLLRVLDGSGKAWQGWWAGGLFLLAILAKENAITFLAIVPLLALIHAKPSLKSLGKHMLPFVVATVAYLVIRRSVLGFLFDGGQEITNLMNNPFVDASGSEKSATISLTLAWYLKLLVFPHPLTHDYYPYHVPLVTWGDWRAILGVAAHVGLLGIAVWSWRKEKLISFAILYYLATLSLVSNILFPVGTFMNERFLYMPSLAFCIVLAWLLTQKLPQWLGNKPQLASGIAFVVLGGLALGYGFRTVTRVPAWENTLTLNSASILISDKSAYSNNYYAYALYLEAEKEQNGIIKRKMLQEALPYVEKSLKIFPEYTDALGTKTGIMVGFFQTDGRIEPLLTWFETVLKSRHFPYIDIVLEDLIAYGQHRIELNYFLQEVGYNHFWVAKGDKERAGKYLQMLKTIDPANPNVDLAISNIQNGIR